MTTRTNLAGLALAAAALGVGLLIAAEPHPGREPRRSGRLIGRPGQAIDVARHAVPGKVTVVEFYSAYCGACRRLAPALERLARTRSDIVVLTVDVNRPGVRTIDFRSPVARQYAIEALPHFIIFERNGKKSLDGERAHRLVLAWIQKLAGTVEQEPARRIHRRPSDDGESDARAGS